MKTTKPKKRRYSLGIRGDAAAETRQRLIEATAALHWEKGISGTSLREIAIRAGVSTGTVYHHFPTYDDAIRACGDHTMRLYPPPDASIFAPRDSQAARVAAFVSSFFHYFELCPWIESIRLERPRFAPIDEGMAQFDDHVAVMARLAVGGDDSAAATLAAISDITPFRLLRKSGMSVDEAAERITDLFLTWTQKRKRR